MPATNRSLEAPQFLTVEEVADLLRVKPRTVYGWVALDRIPHFKPSRNRLLFDREAVIAWVRSTSRGESDGNCFNVVPMAR
jgi:excisionase family DNA binding protein